RVELDQAVSNQGSQPWTGASYLQIRRLHVPKERSFTDVDSYSFIGPVIYNGDKYEKLDVGDLVGEPVQFTTASGWVASIQHHFLAAAIPGDGQAAYSATARPDGLYLLSGVRSPVQVEAGGSHLFTDRLFVGPKLQDQLEETAPKLRLTVDYGWLTIISQPLFWLLSKIHDVVGNWGWAIIIMTVLIKLVFYKLSETSGKSMAKMRKLQPRMKALQERYADDRQKLSQAMMDLYKREKVNPAAGCLPILVQMPVFLALYWVLLESVEMRQAPFMLWINDLSAKDPYFILPLLMGVTMWIQQKLNPAPPDPVQAKVMQVLPVIFTVFFAFFPAGLVLYWFVNNLLSILQQWRINRVVEKMG
ncbi:MAG: membrane protein insertase YidC, partial [Gammaproteobacteria bacterium]